MRSLTQSCCCGIVAALTCLFIFNASPSSVTAQSAAIPNVYMHSNVTPQPWVTPDENATAMNRVFGAGKWQSLRYETVNPATLFSSNIKFIFMEGGNAHATEMEAFLDANRTTMENWVNDGGRLILNAAPNENNGMNYGFGVTLNYVRFSFTATAANGSHPIFTGPFLPVVTSYSGNYFGHAAVSGSGLSPIILSTDTGNGTNGQMVLAEKAVGAGRALFGGMTFPSAINPRPQIENLYANMIVYASNAQLATSGVIISEFRLAGPGGASDEFIELYNTNDIPLVVSTSDGSAGWALVSSDGTVRATLLNGDSIPARGHFLLTNSGGYSLSTYPSGTLGGTGTIGDRTYNTNIPENVGIALFKTATPANFTLANRLDAVGSTSEANDLFKETTGYPALTANSAYQYSFLRDLGSGSPKDTGNNAADFIYVATNNIDIGAGSRLGAPGPQNSNSPIQRNATIKGMLIDPQCAGFGTAASACARVRSAAGANANSAAYGTLAIRRKFTNTTGGVVTRLRFRIVDMTTAPVAGTADLRAVGGTGSFEGSLTSGGTTTIHRLTLEQPPNQATLGGGLNSTLSANSITVNPGLAAGASINVEFILGVQQQGAFRFLVNVEAPPGPSSSSLAAPVGNFNSKRPGTKEMSSVKLQTVQPSN